MEEKEFDLVAEAAKIHKARKDPSRLPYDPKVMARLQRQREEMRRQSLTPEQRAAKEQLERLLDQQDRKLAIDTKPPTSPGEPPARPADEDWSKPDYPSQWAMLFHCSVDTLKRRIKLGTLHVQKLTAKQWRVLKDDLPKPGKQ